MRTCVSGFMQDVYHVVIVEVGFDGGAGEL